MTLPATLTPAGMGPAVPVAGAADRAVVDAFVARALAPALWPGQAVVLDNLSVHQSARARALVEAAGCRLLVPPRHPPNPNPIELAFAELKARPRRAEARSFGAPIGVAGPALDAVTADDARGFFAAGFAPPGHLPRDAR